MTRISLLRYAAMLVALLPAVSNAASDPGTIGFGLDKLHMHMTVAEAKRVYPGLINGTSGPNWLTLPDYQLDRCELSVNLYFASDSLARIDLETDDFYGLRDLDVCKAALLKQLEEQFGASRPPPKASPETAYFRSDEGLKIYVNDTVGHCSCGLIGGVTRYLSVTINAPDAPILVC